MARYALTIFTSAFLLFQVQPLIARFILPWFGGGPAIWTTCMLFFQVLLLGGYLYAHLLSVGVSLRRQATVHVLLLTATLVLLPIVPGEHYKPGGGEAPAAGILLLLLATVGGPYFMLSSTGPLMQRWFSHSCAGRSPYRLYALSNVGSLLALLSYPLVIEPAMRLKQQAWTWSGGYVAFVLLSAWCAWRVREAAPAATPSAEGGALGAEPAGPPTASSEAGRPTWLRRLMWLGLAAAGSAMLLATTNQMCIDVAVVPLLWVVPLSLYLLSFIICFDNPRWYDRRLFGLLLAVAAVAACWQLEQGVDTTIPALIGIYSTVMFACCMTCHGELVRLRPDPRYLTQFYLLVSLGGAVGGLLVALGAPAWFTGFWEYPIALLACCVMTLLAWCVGRSWQTPRAPGDVAFWVWTLVSLLQLATMHQLVYRQQAAAYEVGDAVSFSPLEATWLWGALAVLHLAGWAATAAIGPRWKTLAACWTIVTILHVAWINGVMGRIEDSAVAAEQLQRMARWCVAATIAGYALVRLLTWRSGETVRGWLLAIGLQAAAIALTAWAVKQKVFDRELAIGVAIGYVVLLSAGLGISFAMTRTLRRGGALLWAPALAGCVLLGAELWRQVELEASDAIHRSRNFYGVLQVSQEYDELLGDYYSLTHGQIEHGIQYLDDFWAVQPTTYYGPGTGVDLAMRRHPRRAPDSPSGGSLRIGVIGLGTGSMASYGRKGDSIRFYEINPAVRDLSDKFFTYLEDTPAETEVVIGDARIMLEREAAEGESQQFDVLVVDAFSSDAIPIHLITREAADIYDLHLHKDGVLLLHISNRYLDLNPVARGVAEHLGMTALRIENDDDVEWGVYGSTWIIVTRNRQFLEDEEVHQAHRPWPDDEPVLLWTDDFASLRQVISL